MKTLQEIKQEINDSKKQQHYVYLLYKPDGTPFYVGKGMSNRVSAHEAETRYFMNGRTWTGINMFKINTIKKIWSDGGQLSYLIDSWHDTSESAGDREIALVKFYGRRILNEGPLTNIRDGGNVWSEETRRLFSDRMIQWHQENPWTDEQKQQISQSVKQYCQDHPEFIESLQESKIDWIENNPEEYAEVERARLEVCQSQEHRDMMSEIMSLYFEERPEELERLVAQGTEFWEDNPEAREAARQRAIEYNSHENIIRWLKEEPEACREKWNRHSEFMKQWYQDEPEKASEMTKARNKVLKSDSHRQKMSERTGDYIRSNPKVALDRVDSMKEGVQELKLLRKQCLEILRDRLVESGEIDYCEPTPKKLYKWRKNGLISKYAPDYPLRSGKKFELEKFLKGA